jgi:NAD(P)-dependent dehydrogenase (short-subunit alcohol dehydrogenase family)
VNQKSIFLSVAVVVPYFMEKKAGTILNISSVGGIRVKNGLVCMFVEVFIPGLTEYRRYGTVQLKHLSTRCGRKA